MPRATGKDGLVLTTTKVDLFKAGPDNDGFPCEVFVISCRDDSDVAALIRFKPLHKNDWVRVAPGKDFIIRYGNSGLTNKIDLIEAKAEDDGDCIVDCGVSAGGL